jgi:hypothetical protein
MASPKSRERRLDAVVFKHSKHDLSVILEEPPKQVREFARALAVGGKRLPELNSAAIQSRLVRANVRSAAEKPLVLRGSPIGRLYSRLKLARFGKYDFSTNEERQRIEIAREFARMAEDFLARDPLTGSLAYAGVPHIWVIQAICESQSTEVCLFYSFDKTTVWLHAITFPRSKAAAPDVITHDLL